jgi:hypothetical protein
MTDVFLSYSRADRPVAEAIARELQRLGVDVWWDHDLLGGGDYRRRISDILTRVAAAIVIWSRRSVESQWVISEAAAARERRVLVPVTIDGQEPPDRLPRAAHHRSGVLGAGRSPARHAAQGGS